MGKAEARETYVAVVKIGPLTLREVRAVDSEIDHDTTRVCQLLGSLDHVRRRANHHRNQFRQWNRRNNCIIACDISI